MFDIMYEMHNIIYDMMLM